MRQLYPILVTPVMKPGFHPVKWELTSKTKVDLCASWSSEIDRLWISCNVLLLSAGTFYTRNVTWEHSRQAFVGLSLGKWGGAPRRLRCRRWRLRNPRNTRSYSASRAAADVIVATTIASAASVTI